MAMRTWRHFRGSGTWRKISGPAGSGGGISGGGSGGRRRGGSGRESGTVKRAMDVVVAWKALPPSEEDRASALKMADEVLKHQTTIGASGPSGTPTSGATESQRSSNPGWCFA
ncbi:hypothetical protein Scep_005490 [Stephania cephalantha]|uniref:Uncharacterized protein n=1 Tax=Stephania cephalantha TaxID=152367 RepID=A0AAP0KUD8_9MAGN